MERNGLAGRVLAIATLSILATMALACTDYQSANWAGYRSSAFSDTNKWVGVRGDFIQPAFATPPPPSPECTDLLEGSWVGLGGTTESSPLIQAGTAMMNGSPPPYWAWFEYLKPGSPNPPELMAVAVRPGDSMQVSVSYSTYYHEMNFYVANNTIIPPSDQPIVRDFSDNSYYDGSTAEWIDERPSVLIAGTPVPLDLANFGQVNWFNVQAWADDDNWYPLGGTDYASIAMWDGIPGYGGTILALPSGPSSGTSFTDSWTHC